MASEAYWTEVLIGVYKHLRSQQETIRQLSVGSAALVALLSQASPKFAGEFERYYEAEMRGRLGQLHTASLEAIDLTIAGLQARPKNPN